jgi:hypothetical protein
MDRLRAWRRSWRHDGRSLHRLGLPELTVLGSSRRPRPGGTCPSSLSISPQDVIAMGSSAEIGPPRPLSGCFREPEMAAGDTTVGNGPTMRVSGPQPRLPDVHTRLSGSVRLARTQKLQCKPNQAGHRRGSAQVMVVAGKAPIILGETYAHQISGAGWLGCGSAWCWPMPAMAQALPSVMAPMRVGCAGRSASRAPGRSTTEPSD